MADEPAPSVEPPVPTPPSWKEQKRKKKNIAQEKRVDVFVSDLKKDSCSPFVFIESTNRNNGIKLRVCFFLYLAAFMVHLFLSCNLLESN